MIKEIVQKWDENKHILENYFRNTPQSEYSSYQAILEKIFELVINTSNDIYENYNINKMTIINHGDYQGTLIFIVPKNVYQPCISDYVVTDTYYGSCSGCDTLEAIGCYDDTLPTEEQISQYMLLSLHLVQKMHIL